MKEGTTRQAQQGAGLGFHKTGRGERIGVADAEELRRREAERQREEQRRREQEGR